MNRRRKKEIKTSEKHQIMDKIVAAQGGEIDCYRCGGPVDMALAGTNDDWAPSIEHIIPIVLGGSNHIENLSISHMWCNSRRNKEDGIVKQSRMRLNAKRYRIKGNRA